MRSTSSSAQSAPPDDWSLDLTTFEALYGWSSQPMCLLAASDMRYLYVNGAYAALDLGVDMLGSHLAEVFPEARTSGFLALLERVAATGERCVASEWPLDLWARAGKGRTFATFDCLPMCAPEGDVQAVAVIVRETTVEITRRTRAEREARLLAAAALAISQAEDHHSALAVTLRQVCEETEWIIGQAWIPIPGSGRLRCSSAYYAQETGLEAFRAASETATFGPDEGLPGRVLVSREPVWFRDFVADSDSPRAEAAVAAGIKSAIGLPILASEEVVAVLEFFMTDVSDDDESLADVVLTVAAQLGVAIEAKETEYRRNLERRRVLALLDSLPVGVVFGEVDGSHSLVNRMAAGALGFDREALAGLLPEGVARLLPLAKVDGTPFAPDELPSLVALRTGRVVEPFEVTLSVPGGEQRRVELSAAPVSLDEGPPFGSVVVFTDVSERRAIQDQLRHSQKMEGIGKLAGGVAHDFNNLLTVICGYSDMLLALLPPREPPRELVVEIRLAGDRAASLTRQLLAFSRQSVLEPKVIDLNALVGSIETMLRRLIGEDVDLVSTLDPAVSRVRVDAGQIEQVLVNLAVNARDAMPRGGRLTIETCEVELDAEYCRPYSDLVPGRYVVLSLADTGVGMPPAVAARVFEPFFTTKEVGKGTGLGLSTVYGIVKQSEGHASVSSEVGAGSTFRVFFPATSMVPSAETEEVLQPGRGNETILLVEDEAAVRKISRLALESFGYTVLEAAAGSQGLEMAAASGDGIDLLVTDVVMPAMSGRELAEALRGRRPGLKTLYISGYTEDAIVRHGIQHAEVAFLQKPFSPLALAKKVREVLDGEG